MLKTTKTVTTVTVVAALGCILTTKPIYGVKARGDNGALPQADEGESNIPFRSFGSGSDGLVGSPVHVTERCTDGAKEVCKQTASVAGKCVKGSCRVARNVMLGTALMGAVATAGHAVLYNREAEAWRRSGLGRPTCYSKDTEEKVYCVDKSGKKKNPEAFDVLSQMNSTELKNMKEKLSTRSYNPAQELMTQQMIEWLQEYKVNKDGSKWVGDLENFPENCNKEEGIDFRPIARNDGGNDRNAGWGIAIGAIDGSESEGNHVTINLHNRGTKTTGDQESMMAEMLGIAAMSFAVEGSKNRATISVAGVAMVMDTIEQIKKKATEIQNAIRKQTRELRYYRNPDGSLKKIEWKFSGHSLGGALLGFKTILMEGWRLGWDKSFEFTNICTDASGHIAFPRQYVTPSPFQCEFSYRDYVGKNMKWYQRFLTDTENIMIDTLNDMGRLIDGDMTQLVTNMQPSMNIPFLIASPLPFIGLQRYKGPLGLARSYFETEDGVSGFLREVTGIFSHPQTNPGNVLGRFQRLGVISTALNDVVPQFQPVGLTFPIFAQAQLYANDDYALASLAQPMSWMGFENLPNAVAPFQGIGNWFLQHTTWFAAMHVAAGLLLEDPRYVERSTFGPLSGDPSSDFGWRSHLPALYDGPYQLQDHFSQTRADFEALGFHRQEPGVDTDPVHV